MAKTIRPVNGGMIAPPAYTPVIPVKSEQQLMLEAEIERLRAENARLASQPKTALTLRISEKGALSVYGMGRFPVTLYVEQWERLMGMTEEIKAFIKARGTQLKRKE